MKQQLNALIAIAARDVTKFLRDKPRLIITFVFPFVFIGILGGSLQANLGQYLGYNFLVFSFIGVIGQTLFQSTASGIISLVADRESDFSQEIFVSPISRYTIIFGKILGESTIAFVQTLGIILFGIITRIPFDLTRILSLLPFAFVICLFGGAFGVIVMSKLSGQRTANQIFPFIIFPQFFLAGVFNPITNLPPHLYILSRLAPMTYAVDMLRSVYYSGLPEAGKTTLYHPLINFLVIMVLFVIMLTIGTSLFVQNERNR